MSLIKHDKHATWPVETMWSQDLIDGMFRDMFRNVFSGESLMERAFERVAPNLMKIEEFVDGETCVIRAELPGIDPEKDVEITVADGVLHIHAERSEGTQEDRPDGYRSEFHYGSLARSLRLPDGATEADVTATYKDGILEVRVPAPKPAAAAEPKQISVTRS